MACHSLFCIRHCLARRGDSLGFGTHPSHATTRVEELTEGRNKTQAMLTIPWRTERQRARHPGCSMGINLEEKSPQWQGAALVTSTPVHVCWGHPVTGPSLPTYRSLVAGLQNQWCFNHYCWATIYPETLQLFFAHGSLGREIRKGLAEQFSLGVSHAVTFRCQLGVS